MCRIEMPLEKEKKVIFKVGMFRIVYTKAGERKQTLKRSRLIALTANGFQLYESVVWSHPGGNSRRYCLRNRYDARKASG